jgi:hypothetical protein
MADLSKQLQADLIDTEIEIRLLKRERNFLIDRMQRILALEQNMEIDFLGNRVRNILIRALDTVEKHKT